MKKIDPKDKRFCRGMLGLKIGGGAKPRTERCRSAAQPGMQFCKVHEGAGAWVGGVAPSWWLWPEDLLFRVSDLLRRTECEDAETLILNLKARIEAKDHGADEKPISADMAVLLADLIDAPRGSRLIRHRDRHGSVFFLLAGRQDRSYSLSTVEALERRAHLEATQLRCASDGAMVVTAYEIVDPLNREAFREAEAQRGMHEPGAAPRLEDDLDRAARGIFGSGL